jgi:hypothetical protein
MKFFLMRASKRKKRNKISSVAHGMARLPMIQQEIAQLTREFYSNIVVYTSEGPSGMEEVLNSVPVLVTVEMNERLTAPFEDA